MPKPDIKEAQLSMQMQIKGYKIFIAMFLFGVVHALNLWEFKILIQTEEELIRLGILPPFETENNEDS
ncbi:Oidioi.mRNA.OKI2018_I69.PAR.g10122.t1.cds [Oikopleura dioica]|uniref:Oidioi.mRNA.OKI2018_I69.PAR.g10122.t1.cds n=1 Tax=Oikopleura dioica TaxID=34765 RepID=A0ABN7RRZ6_OIKDI|nr:Oidioi.mRNA.OKI2018_I69.PAR.g10122.t1.cds [Oikopleura dioica]